MDAETIQKILDYEENQDILRERMVRAFRRMHKPSLVKLAKEVGISPTSFVGFYNGTRRLTWRVLWDIDLWLQSKESTRKVDNA